jgi:phage shock protein A
MSAGEHLVRVRAEMDELQTRFDEAKAEFESLRAHEAACGAVARTAEVLAALGLTRNP